ncbi:hypothetical protein [Empedobacter sedimenti]|uniref:hypothetical protein n=1 Tax=Empedobacter sedimenti TaxID=3042610 RepID=UPI0024A64498|nr:hypothetical protein [Empedobacter sedimenti]
MNNINQLFFKDIVDYLTEGYEINTEKLTSLDLISKTYYSYIVTLDNLLDQDIKIDDELLKHNPLSNLTEHHEICIKNLIKLYGEDSPIFKSKKKYSDLYFNELIKEKLFNFDTILSKKQFEELAINKHIPVFFIVDGIQLLKDNYPSERVKEMLKHIFSAIQMYDDITDIGEDLVNNQITYIISKTIQNLKLDHDYYPDNKTYTHKAFFAVEELSNPEFDYINNQFTSAITIAKEIKLLKLVDWISIINAQINDWKLQIEEIRNA